jgi:hypothetical protein
MCWGVAEARELGVYDALIQAGAHHPTYWAEYAGPDPLPPRDFATDTPQGAARALHLPPADAGSTAAGR